MPSGSSAVRAAAVLLCNLVLTTAALAEPEPPRSQVLGRGWMLGNDALGDGQDRWRSVGFSHSAVTGPGWTGHLPERAGEILEYRFLAEVIAPANLVAPDPADRRYAGILSAGLHSHFALGRAEARIGADLVAVGPQTGIARLHEGLHDILGLDAIDPDAHRLEDAVYPTLSAEIGWPVALAGGVLLRPFVDARHGDEDFLRVGADLALGAVDGQALWLRDPVTGQRHVAVGSGGGRQGLFATLGADVAAVAGSEWLPEGGAAVARDGRTRLRAGLGYAGHRVDGFYGLTWLSEEFEGQDDGQLVGSVTLKLRF